jgi:hypothetical protein
MDDLPNIEICGSNVARNVLKPVVAATHDIIVLLPILGLVQYSHTSRDVELLHDEVHFTG